MRVASHRSEVFARVTFTPRRSSATQHHPARETRRRARVGDITRFRSAAAFASYTGTAPIEVLSRRGNPAGDESGRTLGGDYTIQRGRLNPYRRLFEQVTSRTRQHGLYNP